MQKINYNEKIVLKENIKELRLINIDEKLSKTDDKDSIKFIGEIAISGQANCENGLLDFNHPVGVDISLDKSQIETTDINVSLDDFNYAIIDNYIDIQLIMKIDGLKEIEAYFPSQENKEDIEIDKERLITEETPTINIENENIETDIPNIENDPQIEELIIETNEISNEDNSSKSLLKQIFRNKDIKKEPSYLFHSIKKETTYQEIASIYGVDIAKLKKINNDEEIYIGKLILIPKD